MLSYGRITVALAQVVYFVIYFALHAHSTSLKRIIELAEKALQTNNTAQGRFILEKNNKKHKGQFLYKKPQNLKLIFDKSNKTIIFNGKSLWISIRDKILVEQDLYSKELHIGLETQDLSYLRKTYTFAFKDDYSYPIYIKSLDVKVYILELNAINWDTSFPKLYFYIRGDGFIVKNVGISSEGGRYALTKLEVFLNKRIEDEEFLYRLKEGVKIIKNPFTTGRFKYMPK